MLVNLKACKAFDFFTVGSRCSEQGDCCRQEDVLQWQTVNRGEYKLYVRAHNMSLGCQN